MNKNDVLAKLDKYKDSPVEVAINGAGDITVYGNIEGRWLFIEDTGIVAVAKNTANGRFDIGGSSQREMPFTIMHIEWGDIVYVKSYIKRDEIDSTLSGLTPVGTSKSFAEVLKEISSDSILKANSPRGFANADYNGPDGPYGSFKGSAITTSIDGFPKSYENLVNKE